jgi:hypothetical protein
MTLIAARVPVLNSLLFIRDANIKNLPIVDGNGSVWSTSTCVAVSCMPDCDGPTEIIIGDLSDVQHGAKKLLFDARLETPSKSIVVETVLSQKILERNAPDTTTHVQIWTNGLRDSDKIVIGLG